MTSKKSTEWLYYKLVEQSLFPWELMILEMVLVLVFCSITSVSRQWQYLLKFTVACQLRHFQNCIFSCRLSAVLCKYLMFITTAIEDIRWIYIYIYIPLPYTIIYRCWFYCMTILEAAVCGAVDLYPVVLTDVFVMSIPFTSVRIE